MTDERQLVVDAGGTNTRVGLATAQGLIPQAVRSYPNAGHRDLSGVLMAYLEAHPGPLSALCAAVAGPVRGNRAKLTNHAWTIETTNLARATGAAHVALINDLQAQGLSLDDLPARSITPLRPGLAAAGGARLVLGLGTGCNVAAIHRVEGQLFVPASETGHTGLSDRPGLRALYDHLRAAYPHLPVEAALSGPGLSSIHRWVAGRTLPPEAILAARAEGDGQARETLRVFSDLLGDLAGNLCLAHMATAGLFLSGGTARAVAPVLDRAAFEAAFTARGPYAGIVGDIPVSLIIDDTAALRGCACHLRQQTA